MRNQFLVFILLFLTVHNSKAQTSYIWNGSNSSALSEPLNWTPNGIPSDIDHITLNASGNSPQLTDSVSYSNVTISGGSPDLGGYTLYVTGNLVLSGGNINNGLLRVQGSVTNTAVLGATTLAANGTLNIVTGTVTVNGGTYNGPVTLEQNGGVSTTGAGNAVFNNTLSVLNSGTAYFRMNGNVTYNGTVYFETRSSGYILPELTTGSTYNGILNCTTSGTGYIRLAYQGTNAFNENIVLNSSVNSYTYFCEQGAATATLASGKTITAGTFTDGRIYLQRFTQLGATPQNIVLTGTGYLIAGPAAVFNAPVTVEAPQIALNGGTYHSQVSFTKTGAGTNNSNGNNVFNALAEINNSGSGSLVLSNVTRDLYNTDVTFTNTGAGVIYVAHNDATGTQFANEVYVNSTGTGSVRFGQSNGVVLLAPGKMIQTGVTGFSSGALYLRNTSQNGSGPVTFNTLTGTAALYLQQGCVFNGAFEADAPQIYLNGATYHSTVRIVKSGATNNAGTGGNIFNSTVELINNGTGYLMTGNGSGDVFNNDLVCTNNGAGIYLAYSGGSTAFNGNIEITSNGTNGIQFGQSAVASGASVLASGKVISIGAGGFSGSGDLRMRSFNYQDTNPLTFSLTGTSRIITGPGTQFACDVNFSAPQIYLQGCTFNGQATLTKTGATNNDCTGGNVFNSTAVITNNGTATFTLSNVTRDTFNGDVTFESSSTGLLQVAHNDVTGTAFNGNIIVNCSGAGGIRFSQGTGASSLAVGRTISVGTGFSTSSLYLRNFTQVGSTAQSLTFSGTAALYLQPGTTFNADLTVAAPQLYLNGSTFNGVSILQKTGASNNGSTGGNTFNGATTLTNTGSAYLLLGNGSGDTFNNTLTLNGSGTGLIYLGHATGTTYFNDDIYVNNTGSSPGIYFSNSTGNSVLANGAQILVGGSGFTTGLLSLRRFTQTGTTSQSLSLSGTSVLSLGPGSEMNGSVTFDSPQLNLNGVTFNGTATLQKSGATANTSTGGNIFNQDVSIRNSGSGSLTLAGTSGDDFNANAEFIQTGTGALYPAASASTSFAANISTLGTATAITFAQNANGRVVIDGNTAQQIDAAIALRPVIRRLTMSSTGTFTLNVPVDITTNLNMTDGVINTDATNILTMTDESATANVGDANSYVNGPMRYVMNLSGTATMNFPVGKSGDWRPVEFTPTHNATTAYTYTVDMHVSSANALGYLPLPPTIDTVSDVRYWQIDRTPSINANLTSANLRLYYGSDGNYDGVTDPTMLTVVKTDGAGTVWQDIGGTATQVLDGTVLSGNFTSTGLFTFGNLIGGYNPLPVELISFNAREEKKDVILSWSTASETNNDYFVVERSADGVSFNDIHQVDGAGTSTMIRNYSAYDYEPFNGVSYYRLRQVDFDGKYSYSQVESVRFSDQEISIFPNPVSSKAVVQLTAGGTGEVAFILYNSTGQEVRRMNVTPDNGITKFEMDLAALPSGMYRLKSEGGNTTASQKLLKL